MRKINSKAIGKTLQNNNIHKRIPGYFPTVAHRRVRVDQRTTSIVHNEVNITALTAASNLTVLIAACDLEYRTTLNCQGSCNMNVLLFNARTIFIRVQYSVTCCYLDTHFCCGPRLVVSASLKNQPAQVLIHFPRNRGRLNMFY